MAKRRRGPRILLFLGLVLAIPFVIDALVETDEERIARLVEQTIELVEQQDADGIGDLLSEHFDDRSGQLKGLVRDGAAASIGSFLRAWEDIEIDVHGQEILVDDDRAELFLDCGVRARPTVKLPLLPRGVDDSSSRIPLRVVLRVVLEREDDDVWRYRELLDLDAQYGL